MNVSRGEVYAGRVFLMAMMLFTVLPFISIVTTALQPSGSLPSGLEWPADPQWDNFVEAFDVANVTTLMKSSMIIVLTVVPISLAISTMAGFGIGLLRIPGARWLLLLFVFGLTLPFEGIITPLYFLARDLGILNTRLAGSIRSSASAELRTSTAPGGPMSETASTTRSRPADPSAVRTANPAKSLSPPSR